MNYLPGPCSGKRFSSECVVLKNTIDNKMCVCVFQSGLAFLQDLQRDLHVKDHVIQQCISALRDLLSDRKHVASPALQVFLSFFFFF